MTTTMRRRSGALAAAVLSAALLFAACGSDGDDAAGTTTTAGSTEDATSETRSVVAENGTIEIPADPQRIVTIGNTTEPFLDLGGEPVGVTELEDSVLELLPEEQQATYAAAVKVGTQGGEIDLEKLASAEPDLILVQFHSSDWDQVGEQLETVAPTVYWGLDTEWKAFADEIAEAGNVADGLNQQKAEFADKVAKIQDTYAELIANTSFVDIGRWESSDPGTFAIADIGCSEIARDDVGMNFPEAPAGEDPLAYTSLSFEQLSELTTYDVITYPVDAEGQPTEAFLPVVETNTWTALPAVSSGRALGVFCPGNNSYGPVLRYLDSLDDALATLPTS